MTAPAPTHEVAPARLQAPGAVAHKEQSLMSNENRTDDTTQTTAAERAFWNDLRHFTDEHDTGDLSLAAQLVHDAVGRAAGAPQQIDDQAHYVETFWRNADPPHTGTRPAIDAAVQTITEAVNKARSLDRLTDAVERIERKIDHHRNATTDLAGLVVRGIFGKAEDPEYLADKAARIAEIYGWTGALADLLDAHRVVDDEDNPPARRRRHPGERYSDLAKYAEGEDHAGFSEEEAASELRWTEWQRAEAAEYAELSPPRHLAPAARETWANNIPDERA